MATGTPGRGDAQQTQPYRASVAEDNEGGTCSLKKTWTRTEGPLRFEACQRSCSEPFASRLQNRQRNAILFGAICGFACLLIGLFFVYVRDGGWCGRQRLGAFSSKSKKRSELASGRLLYAICGVCARVCLLFFAVQISAMIGRCSNPFTGAKPETNLLMAGLLAECCWLLELHLFAFSL